MRLFVAIDLDDAVRQAAARAALDLEREMQRSGTRGRIAWVAAANLHLTLQFLGEVEPGLATQVAERIAAPFEQPPFGLRVSGIGAFPTSGPPRVVWLGVVEGGPSLAAVHRELQSRLEGLGFPRDDRPFRAHLTIGRVKTPPGPQWAGALARLGAVDAGRCQVERVTLFESVLSPRGPSYTALAVGPLAPRVLR